MKAMLLVCLLAAVATAAPRYKRATVLDARLSDRVRAAEAAWSAAEQETDPAKQTAGWEAAAEAFALVDGDAIDSKSKREAAYAAVLAWKNALHTSPDVRARMPKDDATKPRPLPAREQKLVAALDRFVRYAPRTDPELPGMLFLKATMYRQFDQLAVAAQLFRAIIDAHPRHDVAEFAANLLLDTYNRLHQYDKLVALADELAASTTFLDGRDELAETVRRIQRQAKQKRAEQLASDAKASKNPVAFDAAARLYIELYNDNPEHSNNDEALYNAGVLFTEAGSVGSALQSLTLMRRYYPNSRLAPRVVARIGNLYRAVAMYERAAEQYEEYARLYPGEKDARDAMSDAIFFRTGIGDYDKAIEDTTFYVETFGPRRPTDAALWQFRLTAIYEAQGRHAKLVAHLRDYTRSWGHKGTPEHRVIAHAKLGLALWDQSCRFAGFAGLCVKVAERTPRTCGTGTTRTLTMIARNPAAMKEALGELTSAVDFFDKNPLIDPETRHFYALAKLALADADFERFIALAQPKSGDSQEWFTTKITSVSDVGRRYDKALFVDPAARIAALERGALLAHTFWAELSTGRGANDVRCDSARSFERQAIEGYQRCLDVSVELGQLEPASTRCERALQELAPQSVPPLRERRSEARFDVPLIVAEPPVRPD